MTDEAITEVGIDEQESLYVRPSHVSFEYIYRAGKEVQWDRERKLLLSPKPREWSYVRWSEQITAAAAEEYGVQLRLTPSTVWSNVPANLQAAISKASGSDHRRLRAAGLRSRTDPRKSVVAAHFDDRLFGNFWITDDLAGERLSVVNDRGQLLLYGGPNGDQFRRALLDDLPRADEQAVVQATT